MRFAQLAAVLLLALIVMGSWLVRDQMGLLSDIRRLQTETLSQTITQQRLARNVDELRLQAEHALFGDTPQERAQARLVVELLVNSPGFAGNARIAALTRDTVQFLHASDADRRFGHVSQTTRAAWSRRAQDLSQLAGDISNEGLNLGTADLKEMEALLELSNTRLLIALMLFAILIPGALVLIRRDFVGPLKRIHQSLLQIEQGTEPSAPPPSRVREIQTIQASVEALGLAMQNKAALQRDMVQREAALRALVQERQRAEQAAQAATRAKSEFLAHMSHEIRTPMNGVVGMVDLLQQTQLTATQHRMLVTIQESSQALLGILNDILDFSKIEAGRLEVESVPTCLREVAEGVVQLMLSLANARSLELSVFVSPELPAWALCDPMRLRQVLLNLMANAVKFSGTAKAGRSAAVSLRLEPCEIAEGGAGLLLRVIDNGIGMAPELVAQLFQPFVQADAGTARHYGGTGLGLSITQRLVTLMHGKVTVQSTPGEGSVFSVELPLRACAPAHDAQAEPTLAGVHVIAVTREAQLAELIGAYCRHANATVSIVPDLETAQTSLEPKQAIDTVVLLDLAASASALPALAGVPVVRMVRRGSDHAQNDNVVYASPLLYADLLQSLDAARLSTDAPCGNQGAIEPSGQTLQVEPLAQPSEPTGPRILLAEDNQTNREVIGEQLRLLGYRCDVTQDGAQALKMWQADPKRYAMLLTDCHMPQMDGFALTAAIRKAEPAGSRLPIVAVTANAMQGEAQRCKEGGMDDYLSKPLRLRELAAMLEKWLTANDGLQPDSCDLALGKAEPVQAKLAHWDPQALTELVGDNMAIHRRLIETFDRNAREQVPAICEIVASGKLREAASIAHALKSAARTVGALALGELCQHLQSAGESENLPSCEALAQRLPAALSDAQQAMQQYLAPAAQTAALQ